jgi:hypothetical protein
VHKFGYRLHEVRELSQDQIDFLVAWWSWFHGGGRRKRKTLA